MSDIPRIAITPGEPAGIGPDLCIELAQRAHPAELVVIADPVLLEQRAALLDRALLLRPFDPDAEPAAHEAGTLTVAPVRLVRPARCGELDRANAGYVLDTLREAVEACTTGTFDALVTGPVHKGILNDAGVAFTGHTEWLAEMTGTDVVMMLVAPGLRVALVTTHLPLRRVAEAITPDRLHNVVTILHRELILRFGLERPRILVAGLNPHAGEGGHLGREEIEVIDPVLQRLRARGMDVRGPFPADTLFTPPMLAQADAVLAMYHDQGLPVLKHSGFGRAVNVTLGLPFVRTSVDHGTALELAGTGRARASSLEAALELAVELSRAGRSGTPRVPHFLQAGG